MTTVSIYRNKRNPHKYIEVHNDGYYHNTVKQFMFWKENLVRNELGDRCLHRWRITDLKALLEDYQLVSMDGKTIKEIWKPINFLRIA